MVPGLQQPVSKDTMLALKTIHSTCCHGVSTVLGNGPSLISVGSLPARSTEKDYLACTLELTSQTCMPLYLSPLLFFMLAMPRATLH